jgi:hypothetical protein
MKSNQNGDGKALLGFEKNITLLDGRNLLLSRKEAVTQPGKMQLLYSLFFFFFDHTVFKASFRSSRERECHILAVDQLKATCLSNTMLSYR